ncbi:MAG: hypothetical protein ACJ782_18895 [Actinomycetota bacterium]
MSAALWPRFSQPASGDRRAGALEMDRSSARPGVTSRATTIETSTATR